MNIPKKTMAFGGVFLLVASLTACGSSSAASAKTKKLDIVLSNSYIGNSWRTQMVHAFESAAQKAKGQGNIASYEVVNANNTASQQISQMDDMILQHVSAITIDAASTTALNGVIAKAHAQGIPVISFDSVVTSPYAYKINYNYFGVGVSEAKYVVKRLGGKGNVLLIRGVAGTSVDQGFYNGWMSVLSKYPNIKVVGSVYGNWTETTSQSAVATLLPSLPHVDAVFGEGGEAYGAAEAFKAAHRPIPLLIGGNRGYFIQWWIKEAKANGYTTLSASSTPGVGAIAFYVALDILKGVHVPHSMTVPAVTITQKTLSQYSAIPLNGVASPVYTNQWVKTHLLNQ